MNVNKSPTAQKAAMIANAKAQEQQSPLKAKDLKASAAQSMLGNGTDRVSVSEKAKAMQEAMLSAQKS